MKQRGEMDECVSSDGTLSLVKWSDNNIVHILSSAYNAGGGHEVLRWNKDSKSKKYVNCPSTIIYHNKSMGGVDLLDYLLSLYRIHIKSKMRTLRVIFNFVDLCVVVSWLYHI